MAIIVMLATLATLAVNFLAATGRINGVTPEEISARYPTVITPAGWAFSIWSLIYVGLIAFSIYQLLPACVGQFTRVRIPYLVTCVLNCTWIVLWHHWYVGTCVVVVVLLVGSLILINRQFGTSGSFGEALFTKGVFGLYAGWVTVATLVNFLVYLVASRPEASATTWNGLGVVFLIAALGAAVAARVLLRNFVYPLAVAWAAAAIGGAQSGNTPIVVASAIVCIGSLITAGTVVTELQDSTS